MFERIIGNDSIKNQLKSIVEPAHAYMFYGPDGVGKFLFAREFANKFMCTSEDNNHPCGTCKACVQFESGNNTDFSIIDLVETGEKIENTIKIEQIREMISKIYEKPIISNRKIYIINNADKMTTQAQNCLLKILEEPPKNVMIILVVSNEEYILTTIKSRCVKIRFEKLKDTEVKEYLKENGKEVTDDMLKMYNGSIGRAIDLSGEEEKYMALNAITKAKCKTDYMKIAKIIFENKEDITNLLEYLNTLLYNNSKENPKNVQCITKITEALGKLKYNCNVEMLVDDLMIEISKIQQES